MNKRPQSAIIGLDGVPFSLLDALSRSGVMPFFSELREQGVFTKMRSSLPANSAVSWSSMVTGVNPGEHGVYGFTGFLPGTYTLSFHSSRKLMAKPFWYGLMERVLVMNLPSMYPAQPLNGTMIAGFVSPSLDKTVYPPTLLPRLVEDEYVVDVDSSSFQRSATCFLDNLNVVLEKRLKLLDHLVKSDSYDLLFFVVTGSDRIGHYMWDAYMDVDHEFHEGFLDFFRKVDQALEQVVQYLEPDAPLMMVSDHGMGEAKTSLNLNTLLRQEGFLFNGDNPRKNFNNITEETKAFASETNKIYLNKKERFPQGKINSKQGSEIINDLVDTIQAVKVNGRRVIKKVYLGDEIYHGEYSGDAPDLVIIPERGFSLKTGLFKENLFETDPLPGTHTDDDAFLLVRGDHVGQIVDPSIEDSIHIFKKMIGVK